MANLNLGEDKYPGADNAFRGKAGAAELCGGHAMRRMLPIIAASILSLFSIPPGTGLAAAPHYKISNVIPLGTPDRWDHLTFDPVSHRVYVAHGDRVTVVDGRSGTVIGNITGMLGGTHGIAISHTTGQGFADEGRAGVVAAFNLKTLKVIKRIKVKQDADGIIYDRASRHIFVIDGDSAVLTAIDPQSDMAIATIPTGDNLEFGVSGDNGELYVDGAGKAEIVRIDTKTNTVDAHWPLLTCVKPRGLAIDRRRHVLFSSCSNQVMVMTDSRNGNILATRPIGRGADTVAFDPKDDLAFSSNFDGTLSVVKEDSSTIFRKLPAITTERGARTMALDPKNGRIYLVTADMAVNPAACLSDCRHRYQVTPGTVRLLFLDPVP